MGGAVSAIKRAGSAVYDNVIKPAGRFIGNVGSKVLDIGGKIRDGIGSALGVIGKVPIIGGLVNRALDAPILDGVSLRQAGDVASAALDTGNSVRDTVNAISSGDIDKVVSSGENVYNRGRDTTDKFKDTRQKRRDILAGRMP